MKKSCSTLVLVAHTVNLFLHLRSPTPPLNHGHLTTPGQPSKTFMPFIIERDFDPSLIPDLKLPSEFEEDFEEEKDQLQAREDEQQQQTSLEPPPQPFTVLEGIGGTCGAYLVEDAFGQRGIFKPQSAEGTNADLSPLKRGVAFGDTTAKEIAAFVLGGESSDVPVTTPVSTECKGRGSLQSWVSHKCSAEDMGPSAFSAEEVQKIGILDVRLLNLDRHLGNLLVAETETGLKLIPIDHGYTLPSYRDTSDVHFGWTFWKQCKGPWTEQARATVAAIHPLADAAALAAQGIGAESLVAHVAASLLLRHCVSREISLFRLAQFMQSDMLLDDAQSGFAAALTAAMSPIETATETSQLNFSNPDQLPHPQWNEAMTHFLALAEERI